LNQIRLIREKEGDRTCRLDLSWAGNSERSRRENKNFIRGGTKGDQLGLGIIEKVNLAIPREKGPWPGPAQIQN